MGTAAQSTVRCLENEGGKQALLQKADSCEHRCEPEIVLSTRTLSWALHTNRGHEHEFARDSFLSGWLGDLSVPFAASSIC